MDELIQCLSSVLYPPGKPIGTPGILQMVKCGCITNNWCATGRCGCNKGQLACTVFCACVYEGKWTR